MSSIAVILAVIYAASMILLAVAGLLWKLSGRFRRSMIGEYAVRRYRLIPAGHFEPVEKPLRLARVVPVPDRLELNGSS